MHNNCRIDQAINRADLRDIHRLGKRLILVHPGTRTEPLNMIKTVLPSSFMCHETQLCGRRVKRKGPEVSKDKKQSWQVSGHLWPVYFHILEINLRDSIQFSHIL